MAIFPFCQAFHQQTNGFFFFFLFVQWCFLGMVRPGGSITVLLTSCLTGLDQSALLIKTKIVGTHTADSKPVKQDVNGTVILPPLVFPGQAREYSLVRPIVQAPIHLSMEEVGERTCLKVLLKVENSVLIVGDPLGILGQHLWPCPIP